MSDVTHPIEAVREGSRQGAAKLLPLVYDELRKLAAARMAAEASGRALETAAGAMRRILVDHARARMAAAGRAWRAADLSCG